MIALEHHPTDGRIKIERGDAVQTLTGRMGTGGNNVPLIMSPAGPVAYTLKIRCGKEGGGKGALVQEDRSAALATNNDQTLFAPAFSASKASRFMDAGREVAAPLVATDFKDPPLVSRADYIVRRLTPTECARLQGFPDWWCRGLGTEDPRLVVPGPGNGGTNGRRYRFLDGGLRGAPQAGDACEEAEDPQPDPEMAPGPLSGFR